MKNVKDLIIASALSIMAASCYAGSLVPNTSTGVSADVSVMLYTHHLCEAPSTNEPLLVQATPPKVTLMVLPLLPVTVHTSLSLPTVSGLE